MMSLGFRRFIWSMTAVRQTPSTAFIASPDSRIAARWSPFPWFSRARDIILSTFVRSAPISFADA